MCENSESVQFIFFATIYLTPHLQLKADKRVKRPWLLDVFAPHRTLRWFMLTASRFTLYFRHIAYKSLQNIRVHTDVYAVHEIRSGVERWRGFDGVLPTAGCTRRTLKGQEWSEVKELIKIFQIGNSHNHSIVNTRLENHIREGHQKTI